MKIIVTFKNSLWHNGIPFILNNAISKYIAKQINLQQINEKCAVKLKIFSTKVLVGCVA